MPGKKAGQSKKGASAKKGPSAKRGAAATNGSRGRKRASAAALTATKAVAKAKSVQAHEAEASRATDKMPAKEFERELATLQLELVRMLDWVRQSGHRLVVIFEGRDAAGKGGTIKRIVDALNPRFCRVVALPAPTEREKTQWYFQRYVAHLPAAGEMVIFDRSWYNRAGVERVMGFCSDEEYWDFIRSTPEFESMLVRSGIQLVKYWFSVSDDEQERRFKSRIGDPTRRWKLSPMDLQSRSRWLEYSKAKDVMMEHTSTKESPWWEVESDNKRRARLNCISHLLSLVHYKSVEYPKIKLPPRQQDPGYKRPPKESLNWIPERY